MCVYPYVRMNAVISLKAKILGLGIEILWIHPQRTFVSAKCHPHSSAHIFKDQNLK